MKARYDIAREQFYISVCDFVAGVGGQKVNADVVSGLKLLSSHPTWFAKSNGDYRAYYAYLKAYHAISDYYNFCTQYNNSDAELDIALKSWYRLINPKKNVFTRIVELIPTFQCNI